MIIKFASSEHSCRLKWLNYSDNNNTAIVAEDLDDGSPVGVISINTETVLSQDLVAIKNYSENEGVLESLISNGVVSEPVDYICTGYVSVPVCKIIDRKTV